MKHPQTLLHLVDLGEHIAKGARHLPVSDTIDEAELVLVQFHGLLLGGYIRAQHSKEGSWIKMSRMKVSCSAVQA